MWEYTITAELIAELPLSFIMSSLRYVNNGSANQFDLAPMHRHFIQKYNRQQNASRKNSIANNNPTTRPTATTVSYNYCNNTMKTKRINNNSRHKTLPYTPQHIH